MKLVRLVLAEAWHRRFNALLTVVGVSVAVASVIFVVTMTEAAENETRVIQRDAGLNVRIIPKNEPLDRYWSRGYAEATMPEEYIIKVADQEVANRLIPMLHREIDWNGATAMLTGIAGETFIGSKKRAVFGMDIEQGKLRVGGAVARTLGIVRGDEIVLMGEPFEIEEVLFETGTEEDARVYASLVDVQTLLGLEGQINEIRALECNCSDDVADPLARLRADLEPLLPTAQIIRNERLADARNRQRSTARRFAAMSAPVVVLLCGAWVGALAMMNVSARTAEIEVMRSVGFTSNSVATVFLGRAAVLGLFAALVGGGLGMLLSESVGPAVFRVTAKSVGVEQSMLVAALVAAPLFAALVSLIPAMMAATQDPASALRTD